MYTTFKVNNPYRTPTQAVAFDHLFDDNIVIEARLDPKQTYTRLIPVEQYDEYRMRYNIGYMEHHLNEFYIKILNAIPITQIASHYKTFQIPKATGGFRTINAPEGQLKELHTEMKELFEYKFFCLAHNNAYAYVKERCTRDAVALHQKNESKWFLKMDLKDFFPSCSAGFIYDQLTQLFPFALFSTSSKIKLEVLIKYCLLNNSLPQGTPMSPILTNLLMIPLDVAIKDTFRDFEQHNFIYTRYADDIILSCKYTFRWSNVVQKLNSILETTPFKVNPEKTRYGSSHGRNWNLGLMLNKDNQITIGWKKKEIFRAALFNFMRDFAQEQHWPKEHLYHLQGLISYYRMIEPDFVAKQIAKQPDLERKLILAIKANAQ